MRIYTTTMSLSTVTITLLYLLNCTGVHADFHLREDILGNGEVVIEERSIQDFDSIEVHGAIQLEVSCSAEPTLSISGEENLLPVIETNCRDGKLVIRSTEPYKSTKPIVVKATCSKLIRYLGDGATEGKVTEAESDSFEVELSGASSLVIQKGKVNTLKATVSGACTMNAGNVETSNAKVITSGASKVIVKVFDELMAKASGASSVVNKANAKVVKKQVNGVASVKTAK